MAATRNVTIDIMRTIAIVLMVIFHFAYDLHFFGWVDWNVPNGSGWKEFRHIILTLFFLSVGASLVFAHRQRVDFKSYAKRIMWIAVWAFAISLFTYQFFYSNWIFFGVLHFIAVASILCLPLVRYPVIATSVGVLSVALFLTNVITSKWPFNLWELGLPSSPNDYVALFPWIGVVLLGIGVGHFFVKGFDPCASLKLSTKFTFLGRHSLMVYVLHQPLFFAILGSVYWLTY
ncbi:MAG: DUF1624 domain-containing protein [Alteromonas sp.]|jgi:uncharacterized membrane protein|uniref:DUF1624 domain-containing protein n=1 Tax=Alteromonas sp. R78001 TaxID=3093865 RepID=UPI00020A67E7|nr:protein of unknown function DUF1624 [Glaciecola sp. 4H-3-7+YE-5]MAB94177.1 DUF1624 domain-containing protein [Alteromonas sp.]|tara:strand:- start:6139 stop:6834 length:696 start_codon:yes stop_codon:yes gene_type:complete